MMKSEGESQDLWLDASMEDLESKYKAMAEEQKTSSKLREAAMLMDIAYDTLMMQEKYEEAVTAATEAKQMFKGVENLEGVADCVCIIVKAKVGQKQFKEAEAMANEELSQFNTVGYTEGQAKVMMALAEATAAMPSGQSTGAATLAQQAVSLFRSLADTTMEACAILILAKAYVISAEFDVALPTAASAQQIFLNNGDPKREGIALHNIAVAQVAAGNPADGIEAGQDALAKFESVKARHLEAFETFALSSWYMQVDQSKKAIQLSGDAIDIYRDIDGGPAKELSCLEIMCRAHCERQEPEKGVKAAKAALARYKDKENKSGEGRANMLIFNCQLERGDLDGALRAGNNAAKIFSDTGDMRRMGDLMKDLSLYYRIAEQPDKALKAAQDAVSAYEECEYHRGQAQAYFALVEAQNVSWEPDKAEKSLGVAEDAREYFQKLNLPVEESAMCMLMQQCLQSMGKFKEATQAAKDAVTLLTNQDDRLSEAQAQQALSQCYVQDEQFDKAIRPAERARALYRDLGKKEEECNVLVELAQAFMSVASTMIGEEEDAEITRPFADNCDKAMKTAKEALIRSRKLDDTNFVATALNTMSEVHIMMRRGNEALLAANEAVSMFRESEYELGEAYSLSLCAHAYLLKGDEENARADAEESIALFDYAKEETLKQVPQRVLEVFRKRDAEKAAQQAMQSGMWQQQFMNMPQQHMMMQNIPQMDQGQQPGQPDAPQAVVTMQAGDKLTLSAGLSADVVRAKVSDITMRIIGDDEQIEAEVPLMAAGLTSNSAVLLRDQLSQEIPGIHLPPTLIFDYPSIEAITDFVMEKVDEIAG